MIMPGWRFATKEEHVPGENTTPDLVHPEFTHLRDIYFSVNSDYDGRFTVPTLYDKKQNKIVNNESSEIIRMFYTEFDDLVEDKYKKVDLFPQSLQEKIDASNDWTYNDINNGVYKSGFAYALRLLGPKEFADYVRRTTQEAYEKNVKTLFKSLDRVEEHLSSSSGPYYYGAEITEADVRLFTTIIRFDAGQCSPDSIPEHGEITILADTGTQCMCNISSVISKTSVAAIQHYTNGYATCTGTCPLSRTRPSSSISRTTTRRATIKSIHTVLLRLALSRQFCHGIKTCQL